MPIITLSDIKDYREIKNADSDAFVTSLASRISTAIETYCNRSFNTHRATELHSGTGDSGVLFVDNFPIIGIGSLFDDPDRVFGSDTAFATSDYVFDGTVGYVELVGTSRSTLESTVFSRGVKNIKLIFTSGWALTAGYNNVPVDVVQAALLWAAPQFKLKDQKLHGVSSVERGNSIQTISNLRKMPDEVKELLDPYRVRQV